jgi:hypothetical protein
VLGIEPRASCMLTHIVSLNYSPVALFIFMLQKHWCFLVETSGRAL